MAVSTQVRVKEKFVWLAWSLASSVLVLPAGADAPAPAKPATVPAQSGAVNAHDLGIVEAKLRFCARVDPAAEPGLKEKVTRMVQGASGETLAGIRRSEEYRKAHGSVDDFVAKIDEHNFKRFCSESLAESH